MTVPFNEWLKILAYRDFFDVPRLILASSDAETFWILDNKFEDGIDDYASDYIVCFAGRTIDEAQATFVRQANESPALKGDAQRVPVALVEFDQTRRHKLLLKNLPKAKDG